MAEMFRRLYAARIPGRIEWMFDDGFVWVLVRADGNAFPRLWVDDALGGVSTVVESNAATQARDQARSLAPDWLARGRARTIEAAVQALADAAMEHHPDSEFAHWWRSRRAAIPSPDGPS